MILLVEDNPDDADLTVRAFRQQGYEVEVVRDGAEAIDRLLGTGSDPSPPALPSIVLLDLDLPRVGGLDVLRRLRASPRTRLIPVIVLSSSTEPIDLACSYELGANSCVRKPVRFADLVTVARDLGVYWLERNEAPPASR